MIHKSVDWGPWSVVGMARLGDLERRVMEVLWADPGADATVREVAAQMPGYAYTTVLTVLDRLRNKGLVTRTKDGRAFRYAAASSREEYTADLMREALGAAADRDAVLVRFAESVSPAEAATLRRALEAVDE
ncbi:MAG TPA: BlaI/MecI/CopY family transcriptional regulator [Acidimicrobiales bacterium]|nr:BlaI/MecI/CopY family transcriptional regulator [Acidimicrobiales bacterium]